MSMSADAADTKQSIIELTRLQLRNTQDAMAQRTNDFLAKVYLPALQKAGAGPVGAFGSMIAEGSPFTLIAAQYPDAATWEAASRKFSEDKELAKASDAYYGGPLQFVRAEVTLLRGFTTMPRIEVPPARADKRTHIFELRTYESNTPRTLARKIRMFDEGEIALFRKLNMTPVFFGEAIAGRNMPNLTYMLAYDDLAAREKAWSAFATHPEWEKMKSQPGVSDAEIVSNISNSILRPLPFSLIR
jgi:NIPSNAP